MDLFLYLTGDKLHLLLVKLITSYLVLQSIGKIYNCITWQDRISHLWSRLSVTTHGTCLKVLNLWPASRYGSLFSSTRLGWQFIFTTIPLVPGPRY